MALRIYLVFVFWFLLPTPCYAYLDPGTGNVLIYAMMSFLGALLFSLKGVFYRIIGKKDMLENERFHKERWHEIVLFSEGKIYWNTFRPIVEALLKRNVPFSYYTMDIDDPCLTMNEKNMNNRYIGNGTRAYVKMGKLLANVVISTTPNIGTEGYPIPKSPGIQNLVYVFHDIGEIAGYYRNAFDSYDIIFSTGPHVEPILRKLEAIRNLPAKRCYPVGVPYMDLLLKTQASCHEKNPKEKIVLIAPTWGTKGSLFQYGTDFIKKLSAQNDYRIIIRPHPYSLKVEKERILQIQRELEPHGNISWDFHVDGSSSMQRADVMISDSSSSVRADFLLIYRKPIITLRIPQEDTNFLEVSDLQNYWEEQAFQAFEYIVEPSAIQQLPDIIAKALNRNIENDIYDFIKENLYNWGSAGEAAAESAIRICRMPHV